MASSQRPHRAVRRSTRISRSVMFPSPVAGRGRTTPSGPSGPGSLLDAAGGLGQPRHLAGALGRTGREELVDLGELHLVVLADLADHRRHAVLLVVLAQVVDE